MTRVLFGVLCAVALGCGERTEIPDGYESEAVPDGLGAKEAALQAGCFIQCRDDCRMFCPPKIKPCGSMVCLNGEVCCSKSCGICLAPDYVCSHPVCAPGTGIPVSPSDGGAGIPCGPSTCGPGLSCCNASCGICAPPGAFCIPKTC